MKPLIVRRALVCLLVLSAARTAVYAEEWHVDASQTSATQNGEGWSTAFWYLEDAIEAAMNHSDPEHLIKVAQGVYRPGDTDATPNNSDRTKAFVLRHRTIIQGGYKGGSSNPDERNIDEYITILSGELGDAGPEDNSMVVVRAGPDLPAVDFRSELDGVTIQGGYHFDEEGGGDGAGLHVPEGSSPTMRDCIITGNAVPDDKRGAGVFIETDDDQVETRFLRCMISGNEGGEGAGLSANASVVFIQDCIILENELTRHAGSSYGAGFVIDGGSDVTMLRCQVVGNFWEDDDGTDPLPHGGGGAVLGGSHLLMRNCIVNGNSLNQENAVDPICRGGGIAVISGSVDLVNTLVADNFIGGKEGFGGGLYLAGGQNRVVNCVVRGNQASTANNGPVHGGGVHVEGAALGQMTNTLLYDNFASGNGGGIHTDDGPIVNTTITENSATQRGGGAAAGPGAEFENCIFWGNGDAFSSTTWEEQLYPLDSPNLPTVLYSCIEDDSAGGTVPYTTTGNPEHNIDDDPDFYDSPNDNFRLASCSPAIDAANTVVTPTDALDADDSNTTSEKTPDLDLHMRVRDEPSVTNSGNGDPVVDMGGYEFDLSEQGDMNEDGERDGLDIQPFADCWLIHGPSASTMPGPACAAGDMDLDRDMDEDDVTCFVAALIDGSACAASCPQGATAPDCNDNDIWDATDIRLCDVETDAALCDCDSDGILNECEIADCDSDPACGDANENGIPDGCELDCNANDIPDDKDIADETSEDCNVNDIPDECEMEFGDCDGNDVLDACESFPDCNENGVPDWCEDDCDANGVPDECDLDPTDPDGDQWVDPDCNENAYPDACDLELPPPFGSFDCNDNDIPDECDIAACDNDPACADCNENGVPDSCDIAAELSEDTNENGIPDECEQQMMMMGGFGSGEEEIDAEAWSEFYEWYFEQDFSQLSGSQRFAATANKLSELGLPLAKP